MADTSGITTDSLQAKLISQLQADHVEIEDLSGKKLVHFFFGALKIKLDGALLGNHLN